MIIDLVIVYIYIYNRIKSEEILIVIFFIQKTNRTGCTIKYYKRQGRTHNRDGCTNEQWISKSNDIVGKREFLWIFEAFPNGFCAAAATRRLFTAPCVVYCSPEMGCKFINNRFSPDFYTWPGGFLIRECIGIIRTGPSSSNARRG